MKNNNNPILDRIENLGNRIPHPTLLFIYLGLLVLLLSWGLAALGLSAVHPVSGETVEVVNLLSREGLHRILTNTVSNFTGFAPVGTVLVAMLTSPRFASHHGSQVAPKVQNLDDPVSSEHHVFRLEIPMDDALLVRGLDARGQQELCLAEIAENLETGVDCRIRNSAEKRGERFCNEPASERRIGDPREDLVWRRASVLRTLG